MRSILYAHKKGYGAVESLLRAHRQWTTEDEKVRRRHEILSGPSSLIDPSEFSLAELIDVLTELDEDLLDDGLPLFKPRNWHKRLAILVKQRAAEAGATNAGAENEVLEDAAHVALQAVRRWNEEKPPVVDFWGQKVVKEPLATRLALLYELDGKPRKETDPMRWFPEIQFTEHEEQH